LAKAADQFRSSDVTIWGIVALLAWGTAVLAANLSGLVPASTFAALHASRLDGGTVNQVRSRINALEAEAERMRRENNLLLQRFDLAEQARSEVTQRVGALEVSVPQLIERLPEVIAIDGSVTASIVEGKSLTYHADGGSVTVEQKPLVSIARSGMPTPAMGAAQDPVADGRAFGVALGFPVAMDDAEAQWQGLLARVGTLLIGLWPVLADTEAGEGRQMVAGPVETQSQAAELCERMSKVGIPCRPVAFAGEPLPMLN
jgi:hypothetical protein